MNDNDIVFLDSDMRLCGFSVGMSYEEINAFILKYNLHTDTMKRYRLYWEEKLNGEND